MVLVYLNDFLYSFMFYFSLSRISLPVFPLLPQPFPHSFLSFFPTTLSLSEDLIISVIKLSPALLITFAEPCLSFDTFYMPSFYGKDHPHIFHHAITCIIVSYFLNTHACTHRHTQRHTDTQTHRHTHRHTDTHEYECSSSLGPS